MPLEGQIFRPPAEADSLLLQVTVGCSHNRCAFCSMYSAKQYRAKAMEEIADDISEAARIYPRAHRVFLCDGNALSLGFDAFREVCVAINAAFPRLRRIASYVNAADVLALTLEELAELRRLRFSLAYLGLESGSAATLALLRKGATPANMLESHRRAAAAGVKTSIIGLLGVGGQGLSHEHVRDTVAILNQMQPRILSFLTMVPRDGTAMWRWIRQGDFHPLTERQILLEMRDILVGLDLESTVFRANHRSNLLALEGRLPRDKARLVSQVEAALPRADDTPVERLGPL